MTENEYPWPREDDDPLLPGDDWWHNACLYVGVETPWSVYASGYKLAADIVVNHVKATRGDQDFLVYPVLFNYRQYIELSLKAILRDARELLDEPGGIPNIHDLGTLWGQVRPLLLRVEPNGEADLKLADGYFRDFANLDPTSYRFRYPVDTKGKPTITEELLRVNLRQLSEVVDRLSGFLDGAAEQVSVYLDRKHESET